MSRRRQQKIKKGKPKQHWKTVMLENITSEQLKNYINQWRGGWEYLRLERDRKGGGYTGTVRIKSKTVT